MSSRILTIIAILVSSVTYAGERNKDWNYTSYSELNLINKLMPTENPLARLDSARYKDLNEKEKEMCNCSTGHVFSFTTNSSFVGVRASFSYHSDGTISAANSSRGFDLYIEKDGAWVWAGSAAATREINVENDYVVGSGLGTGEKKCLLYLPHSSHLSSLEVITESGSDIQPAPSPFAGRIAVYGSSFTHGAGCSRCGMLYTAQLARMTGYNFINMGFSGEAWMRTNFADILIEAEDIDAYVFDCFSNPTADVIKQNLFPFIEKFQEGKPGVPLIFMKTAFREIRLVNEEREMSEAAKMAVADSLMKIAVKKYKNVYYISSTNTVGKYHECTTDGIHPDNHGYTLWAESIRKDICRILKKYIIQ